MSALARSHPFGVALLVFGLIGPASAAPLPFAGAAIALPTAPVTQVAWRRHENAIAGAAVALGVIGLGAAALAAQNRPYYEAPQPVYRQPHFEGTSDEPAPYYDAPAYAESEYAVPVEREYYPRHDRYVRYDRYGNAYRVGPRADGGGNH